MANVTPSIAPGSFADVQTMTLALSDQVDYINYTLNGAAPVISEYIAYDNLTPPGPFIAVTQDGSGNVVYDGGFPKFYNVNAPSNSVCSVPVLKFNATLASATANSFYYEGFSTNPVTLAAGDKLVYDMFLEGGADNQGGIDAVVTNGAFSTLRSWNDNNTNKFIDQNGKNGHPGTTIPAAMGQWYHRELDLSFAAGATITQWQGALEGETPGNYSLYIRNAYVLDASGNVKSELFAGRLFTTAATPGAVSGYTGMTKQALTPIQQLPSSFKYLYNAINYTASAAKVANGNKSILLLGDASAANGITPYQVKSTGDNGFFSSFTRLAAAAGFTLTVKDSSDYSSGLIDVRLAELEQYACVILIAAGYGGTAYISDGCVQDLQTYRSNGSGIVVITDDGPDITSVAGAYPCPAVPRQFFATANKLVVNFGVYFTGNYDRTPVQVGFLRANYGDHPLYAGMLDSEYIQAGGSESKVVVATFTKYTSANLSPFNIPKGRTTIKILALLKNGTIETYSLVYSVASGELLAVFGGDGNALSAINVGWGNATVLSAIIKGSGLGTLAGDILVNNTKIATLSYSDANGSATTWVGSAGAGFKVNNGDVVKVRLTSPFTYSRQWTVTRKQPDLSKVTHLHQLIPALQAVGLPSADEAEAISALIALVNAGTGLTTLKLSSQAPLNIQNLKNYFATS